MQKYTNLVQDNSGNALTGVTVTVYLAGTLTLATLYNANGSSAKANPFTNDSDGTFEFYTANGRYDLVYAKTSYTFDATSTSDQLIFDTVTSASREVVTYSTSMTPNQLNGWTHTIAITDGVAFTINNPTNSVDGEAVIIRLSNTSGGAHGAITWGAGYKMAGALAAIATGFNRTIAFHYNGTNWIELFRSAADVAN